MSTPPWFVGAGYRHVHSATVGESPTACRERRATCELRTDGYWLARRAWRTALGSSCPRSCTASRHPQPQGEHFGVGIDTRVAPRPNSKWKGTENCERAERRRSTADEVRCPRGSPCPPLCCWPGRAKRTAGPPAPRPVLHRSHMASPKADAAPLLAWGTKPITRCRICSYAERGPWRRSCFVHHRFAVRTSPSTL
jgi:hypothetical protein